VEIIRVFINKSYINCCSTEGRIRRISSNVGNIVVRGSIPGTIKTIVAVLGNVVHGYRGIGTSFFITSVAIIYCIIVSIVIKAGFVKINPNCSIITALKIVSYIIPCFKHTWCTSITATYSHMPFGLWGIISPLKYWMRNLKITRCACPLWPDTVTLVTISCMCHLYSFDPHMVRFYR